MKLNGIFGKGSGKVGESVWAVVGGEQIVRPYNPNVSNPQTPAQTEQRARFKLMSQIAADLASVIAIPKDGLKSSRNLFVSKNIGLVTFADGKALCDCSVLQITGGNAFIPSVAPEANGSQINLVLAEAAPANIGQVIYVICKVDETQQLSVVASVVASLPGPLRRFEAQTAQPAGDYVILCYGLLTSAFEGGVSFENYEIVNAQDVAQLAVYKRTKNGAADFTKTTGAFLTKE
jgi:hypothetical protein